MRISTIVSALETATVSYAFDTRRNVLFRRARQIPKFRGRIIGTYQTMMHRLIDVSSERAQYAMMLGQREEGGK